MSKYRAAKYQWLFVVWCLAATPWWAQAIDPGIVRGHLFRDQTRVALNHAYVYRFDDLASLAPHANGQPALRILLSATAIDDALLQEVDSRALERDAQRLQWHGVLLTTAVTAEGNAQRATLLILPAAPGIPLYTVYDATINLTQRDNRMRGQLDFDAPHEDLTIDADFSAPIFREVPPLENLFEDRARESDPARAYLEFERHLKKGDFATARQWVTAGMAAQLQDLDRRAQVPGFTAQFSARLPETAARRAEISQVVIYPRRAYIVVKRTTSSLTTLRLEHARWLVDE